MGGEEAPGKPPGLTLPNPGVGWGEVAPRKPPGLTLPNPGVGWRGEEVPRKPPGLTPLPLLQFLFLPDVLQWRAHTTPEHPLFLLLNAKVRRALLWSAMLPMVRGPMSHSSHVFRSHRRTALLDLQAPSWCHVC